MLQYLWTRAISWYTPIIKRRILLTCSPTDRDHDGHSHDGHSHGGHTHGDKHVVVREHPEPARTTGENDISRRSISIHSVYGLPAQNRVALNQAAEEMYAWCRTSNDGALGTEERGPVIDGLPVPSTSQMLHSNLDPTPARHSLQLGDLSIHSVYGSPAQNRPSLNQAVQEIYAWPRTSDVGTLDRQERGESLTVTESANPHVPSASQKLHSDLEPTPTRHLHQPRASSNGALNARAVFIHVLGDALGSLGVVISGLIIWFTKSQARFYADPALSLVITILIISSAVPLGKLSFVST
jgi:Co/Zn/Cd efflux system component